MPVSKLMYWCVLSMILAGSHGCAFVWRAPHAPLLRAHPATMSPSEVTYMIQANGFNHPTDVSGSGLSGRVQGTFRHAYTVQERERETVIVDAATDLMWQQSGSDESITWGRAKAYINHLNEQAFAGFRDWRLPTIEELASLLEFQRYPASLFLDPHFDALQTFCWSSDELEIEGNVWFVYFAHGYISNTDSSSLLYVRAVRSL